MSYIVKELRVNQYIFVPEVRLIGEGGEQLGIMPTSRALDLAREQGLDLVEVAPASIPPVCRLMNYGRFKYEQTRKEREARKRQRGGEIREVRLRPKIDDHDLDRKTRLVMRLLEEGDKVLVRVRFRGRELDHPDLGRQLLEKMTKDLVAVANVEKPAALEGRTMTVIFSSKPTKQVGAEKET